MTITDPVGDIEFVEEQIEIETRQNRTTDGRPMGRADTMRPILWRLHFIGGFLAGPIIVSLAFTGILFAWNAEIDDVRFASVLTQSAPSGAEVPLADQVRAAAAARPDWAVFSVTPGTGDRTTAVTMDPPGGSMLFGSPTDAVKVYVDRSTGQVTGEIAGTDTADSILRSFHSSWRLGPQYEPLTELAGSLFVVSLLTGLYLWWPGLRKRGSIAFAARRGLRGRRRSKEWHNFIGVALLVPMLFLAATGLAWTQFASDRLTMVGNRISPPSGGVESALAPGHHGTDAATASGQLDLGTIDAVWDQANRAGLQSPVNIAIPADADTAWTATSGDNVFPAERDAIAVDGTTGEVASRYDYSSEHWWNKLSTAGQLFHEGKLFGVSSQVLMSLLALAIVVMTFYGYKMWWQRRPAGGMGAPPPIRAWARNAPVAVLVATAFLVWAMPVLAVAIVVWLAIEAGWRWLRAARDHGDGEATGPLDLLKAGILLVAGVAMVVAPSIGDAESATYWTMPRLAVWAWSRPLGVVFVVVGLIGVYAVSTTGRRPSAAA